MKRETDSFIHSFDLRKTMMGQMMSAGSRSKRGEERERGGGELL
jgi:hypothetical protein